MLRWVLYIKFHKWNTYTQKQLSAHKKKLKIKWLFEPFLRGLPSVISKESGGRRSEAVEAGAIYSWLQGYYTLQAAKKPSNDAPSTRIRMVLKQQLPELGADWLISCELKALSSENAFLKVSWFVWTGPGQF